MLAFLLPVNKVFRLLLQKEKMRPRENEAMFIYNSLLSHLTHAEFHILKVLAIQSPHPVQTCRWFFIIGYLIHTCILIVKVLLSVV